MLQTQPTTPTKQAIQLLGQVKEGMAVYNSANEHIGSVEAVYLGAASEIEQPFAAGPATDDSPKLPGTTTQRMIAEIFDPDEVPEEVAERLRYSGYLRIDPVGLFTGDRYVTPEKIASVSKKGVFLRTEDAAKVEEV
jgi:hypothetical protein